MYRFSKHNYIFKGVCGNILLYNTLNGGVLEIDKDNQESIDFDVLVKNELTDNEKFLFENGFIVDFDYDEDQILESVYKEYSSDESLILTFMTTENCNFRCDYCYEERKKEVISDKLYKEVLQVIKSKHLKHIYVSWFGGEPTLEISKIVTFMSELQEYCKTEAITLISVMTTNGYLLNEKNVEALVRCGVNKFAVTLDGLAKDHDRFRYLEGKLGSFDRIVDNLKMISNTDLDFIMTIRTNFTIDTDVKSFIDYFNVLFKNDERFQLYFRPVGNWDSNVRDYVCNKGEGSKRKTDYERYAFERKTKLLEMDNFFLPMTNICYASLENSIVINHKGEIQKCTVYLDDEKNIVGKIKNDRIILDDKKHKQWIGKTNSSCEGCVSFIKCYKRYCPMNSDFDVDECRKDAIERTEFVLGLKYKIKDLKLIDGGRYE